MHRLPHIGSITFKEISLPTLLLLPQCNVACMHLGQLCHAQVCPEAARFSGCDERTSISYFDYHQIVRVRMRLCLCLFFFVKQNLQTKIHRWRAPRIPPLSLKTLFPKGFISFALGFVRVFTASTTTDLMQPPQRFCSFDL